MIYVGIDIAKLNHFASALSSDGEILLEPFKFTNDNDGFYKLLSVLSSFEKDSLIIVLESTAHYGNTLLNTLFLNTTRYVSSTLFKLLRCERITFARQRQIRLIPPLLQKLL